MPQRNWGVFGGLLITTVSLLGQVHAAQEPIMRVLVLEAEQLRFRADGDKPLLVSGIGSNLKRLSTLKIRQKNGQFKMAMNGSASRWSYLSSDTELRIRSKDTRGIWLGKRRYRGELRVVLIGDHLKVINYLGIEKYLASVVGSEMPKSWPMPALKAQAVAARTYALQQIKKKNIYDVNSTEQSQVYLGIESETKSTRQAVDSTRSLVLKHKGRLINAVFHSSSGGRTEASGAVWKKQLPYLVSVRDHDQHSPTYKWKRQFSPSQLEVAFQETGGLDRIQVLKSSDTGRIVNARINGPLGDLVLTGQELRSRLRLKSTLASFQIAPYIPKAIKKDISLSPSLLPERNSNRGVDLLPIASNSNWSFRDLEFDSTLQALDSPSPPPPISAPPPLPPLPKKHILIVKGSGAGHGVGMSQWGAHGLAEKGANFRKILTHYYKGVEILRLSST